MRDEITKARNRIDTKVAEILCRAHMKQTRSDDVLYLCQMHDFYRGELYAVLDRVEDAADGFKFNERMRGRVPRPAED